MEGVTRIGVSLEPELLEKFDNSIRSKGYVSRSEAVRDLIRDSLAENEWKNDEEWMVGTVVLIYDHTLNSVGDKLTDIQHSHMATVNTSVHVHLDSDKCMEILICEGKLKTLKAFADEVSSIKGVLRGRLTMAAPSTGNLHHIGHRHRGLDAVHSEHYGRDACRLLDSEQAVDQIGGGDGRVEHPWVQAPEPLLSRERAGVHDHARLERGYGVGVHDEVLRQPDGVSLPLPDVAGKALRDVMAKKLPVLVHYLYRYPVRAGEARVAKDRSREILADAFSETHGLHVHGTGEDPDGVLLIHYLSYHLRAQRFRAQDARPGPDLAQERFRTHMEV
ncbi:MAG: nickel-responsive transcriptional regulator NikR [Candidatus Methanomethylophilaceae archaeon]|nr:nickel-responsive transcriptional regulator NikR [Candidatus Methanomethylophilaceae archaeon]